MELKVSNAAKSFGKKALFQGLNFTLKQGEVLGLFGRNGSGKSTLLKMIFGVTKADAIRLEVGEQTVAPKDIIPKRLIAYLPQERFVPKRMLVRDMIAMCHQDEATLDKIFYSPGITKMETQRCGQLSEGQLKYLEILLIAYLDHPFLMLDEPFSMIDPLYKDLIKELITGLKTTKGILLTDHYYDDVLQIADRSYLLHEGAIREVQGEEELRKEGYLPGKR